MPISEHWAAHRRSKSSTPFLIAPERPRAELYAKIDTRVDIMFASGLREEVRQILASGVPRDAHALKAIGYRQLVDHLNGDCDLESAIHNTKAASRKLAKRQLTWLRSLTEGTLQWLPPADAGGTESAVRLWSEEAQGKKADMSKPASSTINIQDPFFYQLRKESRTVHIYLSAENG